MNTSIFRGDYRNNYLCTSNTSSRNYEHNYLGKFLKLDETE